MNLTLYKHFYIILNSGDSEGQGSLTCCSPWGCKGSDTTERRNNIIFIHFFHVNIQFHDISLVFLSTPQFSFQMSPSLCCDFRGSPALLYLPQLLIRIWNSRLVSSLKTFFLGSIWALPEAVSLGITRRGVIFNLPVAPGLRGRQPAQRVHYIRQMEIAVMPRTCRNL